MSQTPNVRELLDLVAARVANKLSLHPNRLCPRLMTLPQAALYLGFTEEAVKDLIKQGAVAIVRACGGQYLDRYDLDDWIEDSKQAWANLTRGSNVSCQ